MIFILFLLISVEEDREIPIVFPDYTDSLPVLFPSTKINKEFSLSYGYPDLFFSSFKNKYINIGIKREQDIDKYLKWWEEITINTYHFNLFFKCPYIGKSGAFMIKPLLDLDMNWNAVIVDMHIFPKIFAYIPDTFPTDSGGYARELRVMSSASLGFLKNGILVKFFRENICEEKNGIIIQYANQDRGMRIKMSDKWTGELGYFSPFFYIRGGRGDIVNMDSLAYIPFVYPDTHNIVQDYGEFGFLFSKIRVSRFHSSWSFNYDTERNVFSPQFYSKPMWVVSFLSEKENNGISFLCGIKGVVEMAGIRIHISSGYKAFRFDISGYGGYFKDYGYYSTGGISFRLKKRFSPFMKIDNINSGKMLGHNFLCPRISVGLKYENIQ